MEEQLILLQVKVSGWWYDTNASEVHAASIFTLKMEHGPLKRW
jgi:hypothetical protein